MTNEEALKILDTIPTISEQVDALEMAIKALETIPKYKNAYNKGYEAGVKATNVDCGVVWEERIDAIRKLLISDGMKKRFMLEANNGMKAGWVLDSEDSDEMIHGAISGLIWQLNQFILCNMRNRSSFEFVEQYDILDQIYEQYLEKDPEVAAILKEYIDYCKKFIQHSLASLKEDTFTGEDLAQMRQEVYNGSSEAKEVII